MSNKFWNFVRNEEGGRILRLEGPIDSDNLWGDAVTPQAFREELEADEGNITVWINSPGGSVFAASEIYTMLCDYNGKVTVKIDALAASAASVVAMAGDRVLISPVGMLFIHDPMTIAMGNSRDMEKAISALNEIKESIINAYVKKSGLSRNKISKLMSDETWLNAKKAVEYGFADDILFSDNSKEVKEISETDVKGTEVSETEASNAIEGSERINVKAAYEGEWQPYSTRAMGQAILNRLIPSAGNNSISNEESNEAASTEAVLGSGVNTTAEETSQEIQAAQEETSPATLNNPVIDEEATAKPNESDEPNKPDKAHKPDNTHKPDDQELKIGLNGKTQDGAMPYVLLEKQLNFLK